MKKLTLLIISVLILLLLFSKKEIIITEELIEKSDEINYLESISMEDIYNIVYTEAPANNFDEYALIIECVLTQYYMYIKKNPDKRWDNFIKDKPNLFYGLRNMKKINRKNHPNEIDTYRSIVIFTNAQLLKPSNMMVKHFMKNYDKKYHDDKVIKSDKLYHTFYITYNDDYYDFRKDFITYFK